MADAVGKKKQGYRTKKKSRKLRQDGEEKKGENWIKGRNREGGG